MLFFNVTEGYRISHPVSGGDASLSLAISERLLHELAPSSFLRDGATLAFRQQRLRIDARTQSLVALLRHSLRQNIAEPLEAESVALTLVQRALGPRPRTRLAPVLDYRNWWTGPNLYWRAIWLGDGL